MLTKRKINLNSCRFLVFPIVLKKLCLVTVDMNLKKFFILDANNEPNIAHIKVIKSFLVSYFEGNQTKESL